MRIRKAVRLSREKWSAIFAWREGKKKQPLFVCLFELNTREAEEMRRKRDESVSVQVWGDNRDEEEEVLVEN